MIFTLNMLKVAIKLKVSTTPSHTRMGPLVAGVSGCITNWLVILNRLKMGKEVFLPDMRKHGMTLFGLDNLAPKYYIFMV